MKSKSSLAEYCFVFLLLMISAEPVYSYVDPGSGSVIVTAILGFFAAIGYTMRKQYYKVKNIFKKNDSNKLDLKNDDKEMNNEGGR